MSKNPLFCVGPVTMDKEILDIGSKQLPYFRTEEFSKINLEIEDMIKELCFTNKNSRVALLTMSGTGAMEAAVLNCFDKDDKVLIVSGGSFGQRFEEICEVYSINYETIKLQQGETLRKEELYKYENKGYTGLLINAHETSTGVYYNLDMIGEFCEKQNILFVVDAISSFLADNYYMDKWNIDVTILSSQKALALPPGMSFIVMNEKALKIINNNKVKAFYLDLKKYIIDMKRGQTPFTPAVGILLQLKRKLEIIKYVGIENIINNTSALAKYFRDNINKTKFKIPSNSLSNFMTPLEPLNNKSAYEIYLKVRKEYSITMCPNGGNLKDKIFRVGHVGKIELDDIKKLLKILNSI